MTQDEVLDYLVKQYPNKPTQREIAKALKLNVGTVNEQLQHLAKNGSVYPTGKGTRGRRYVASPETSMNLIYRIASLEAALHNEKIASDEKLTVLKETQVRQDQVTKNLLEKLKELESRLG
jgi:DNA-binding transcriptional regulator YhcF (GntR family)